MHEELLGILLDHKWRFEDHFLNVVEKIKQKIRTLARISKYMTQKELRMTMKALAIICILFTNLDNS